MSRDINTIIVIFSGIVGRTQFQAGTCILTDSMEWVREGEFTEVAKAFVLFPHPTPAWIGI